MSKLKDPQMGAKARRWMTGAGRTFGRIVEVGVYEGTGTARLAAGGARVWAVDRWRSPTGEPRDEMCARVRERFREVPGVVVLRMDSLEAAATLLEVEGPTMDMVFIDADHSYEAVRRDIEAWAPLVRPGGLLAGHDYHRKWPGVVRAVDEVFQGRATVSHGSVWSVLR